MSNDIALQLNNGLQNFLHGPNAMRSLLVLLVSIVIAYWLSHIVARLIVRIAQYIAIHSDSTTNEDKKIKLRRVETYLSIGIAMMRALIVGVVAFYSWQLFSPAASLSAATIGASAFFIVIAGATIGMILRDITAGATMIIEQWFNVGDFIRVEPFLDVSGVVERMTLRSTRIRSLNGEVIWMHNQHIQSVKVTPFGLRTIAIDVFVNNKKIGRNLVEKTIATIPIGTMTVAARPEIVREEQWSDYLHLITIIGHTPPGREWLMENYFVDSLKDLDSKRRGQDALVRPPIVRYADPAAERSFKRAVRLARKEL